MKAVIDFDCYKFHCSAAGETRRVKVVHKKSGDEYDVSTRTEFYGNYLKKGESQDCLLFKLNSGRESPLLWDEFEYIDYQIPEPIENVFHSTRVMIESDLKLSGANKFTGFIGLVGSETSISQRVAMSTLLEYKGNRKNQLKPIYLDDVGAYIKKVFKAIEVSDMEADDYIVMEAYKKKDHFVMGEDKDYWGQPINNWDRNQQDRGIVNCNCFGGLFIDKKHKVRGWGRQHLYFQILSGDTADNYKANCMSDVKWADKKAYKALANCKNDVESFKTLADCYKMLYPEKKIVKGWRGDDIEIDWFYVLNENFHLARMVRFSGDVVDFRHVLELNKII